MEGRKREGLDGTPTTSDDGWPQGSCSGSMEVFQSFNHSEACSQLFWEESSTSCRCRA